MQIPLSPLVPFLSLRAGSLSSSSGMSSEGVEARGASLSRAPGALGAHAQALTPLSPSYPLLQ